MQTTERAASSSGADRRALPDRRRPTRVLSTKKPAETERRSTGGRRATDATKVGCPFCGSTQSTVVRSRGLVIDDQVARRRQCAECQETFPTAERVDYDTLGRELAAKNGEQALGLEAPPAPAPH